MFVPTPRKPSDAQTVRALRTVGRALGCGSTHVLGGTYYFVVSDRWAFALSPDDAGRFRLSAFYGRTEVATLWALATDLDRLADLAQVFKAEVEALTR